MANWTQPTLGSTYANFLADLKARDDDAARMFATGSPSNLPTDAIKWNAASSKWEKWNGTAFVDLAATYGISVSGAAGSANTLTTGRTITLTGDVTGTSAAFNGSANLSFAATLANSGVTAGTYPKVTVDAKGRVTAGAALAAADIPATLDSAARVAVRVNTAGANTGSRRRLNFIPSSGVTISASDDSANEEIDITIGASGLLQLTGGTLTGNVTIDRESNFSALVVGADRQYTSRVEVSAAAGNIRELTFSTGSVTRWSVRGTLAAESGSNVGSDFSIVAYNDAGADLSTPFTIRRSTGYIGINNVSPAAQLDVTGDILASGDITSSSDARLKSDIRTIEKALDKVLAMRGVYFTKDGKPSLGLIAQETQGVVPEVVHQAGDYLSVAYGNLVGLLVEAVKDLAAEVRGVRKPENGPSNL